jgi:hypothetical protein
MEVSDWRLMGYDICTNDKLLHITPLAVFRADNGRMIELCTRRAAHLHGGIRHLESYSRRSDYRIQSFLRKNDVYRY